MNKIKDIYIDVDGVLVLGERFSSRYCKEFDIKLENMDEFFSKSMPYCVIGRADLEEELEQHLKKWSWHGTAKELVNYWLHAPEETNHELIKLLNQLIHQGIRIFVVTQQEANRANHLRRILGEELAYTGFFSSHIIGHHKKDPQFYQSLLRITQSEADKVLFIDDDIENIQAANTLNIQTEHFQNTNQIITKLTKEFQLKELK
jgi:putative hydrolase of the HAD superfamily